MVEACSREDRLKNKTTLIRCMLGALAVATLLVAPLGCASVDESGEAVGEVVEALNAPALAATPSPVAFGSIAHGTTLTLAVTLNNTGDAKAISITAAYPPDTYRSAHSPPMFLDAGTSSNVMQITFAPTRTGLYSSTIVVTYKNIVGLTYTLNIPVTGTGT